ncbi:protein Hook homolog 2-like [Hemicordylus capensis]|uniref:protein Hook homolog 2-like n=1 Tax=Hemicordylus capensis TaxID=884348 RepID=UPI002302F06E|nr:protein Hook homolog 2-like [Hemicordylus capensis]
MQARRRHLQTLSDANAQEKLALMEDATKLKKLVNIFIQDVSHKEGELLKIWQEVQQTVNAVKEKEHKIHLLETQLQQQIQQHQDMEEKLTRSRSECIQLQALLHQRSSQSTQQHIAKELCEQAEKLRQVLKEKKLSADEDKYLHNKMAENCRHRTRENGHLQAQVLEAARQLSRERQLREEESISHSRRVSELACGRERTRQLEMKLTYLETQLQDERQRILKAQEQAFCLQQEKKTVAQNEQLLQSQLTDLERCHSKVQLENSKLQLEKTHLVEHISYLHKQISEKEKEINFLYSHVNTLSSDLSNLKFEGEKTSTLQKE